MTEHYLARRRVLALGGQTLAALLATTALPLVWPNEALGIDWDRLFRSERNRMENAGKVKMLSGSATASGRNLSVGSKVMSGELIQVSRGGEAVILLVDNTIFRIYGGSEIEIALVRMKEGFLRLLTGAIQAVIPQGSPYLIAGLETAVAIKGTVVYREVFPPSVRTGRTMDGTMEIPQGVSDYFCNCFGTVNYLDQKSEASIHTSHSTYHDAYFLSRRYAGMLKKAPMLNHFDPGIRRLIALQEGDKHDIRWLKH